jgi:uncharacterized protein (TIGR02145 family)
MAKINWLVQSCCNPAITGVVAPFFNSSTGIVFQDSLRICYTVVQTTLEEPNIFLNPEYLPTYKDCSSCISDSPCPPLDGDTKTWLVQSCCDKAITQIIADNILVPGDIFQDVNGDCYTVLMTSEGAPTIIIGNGFIYKTCEDCGKCIPPSPSVTPTVTQTPFPTPSITPSVTVTPSPTTVKFVNSSPSPTPTVTVSRTPSVTPSINTPLCKCITYINTSISNSYQSFYTTCDGFIGAQFTIAPQQTIQVCGSNPSAGNPAVTFYTGSYCQNEECVAPDISPSPTPTPSATLVTAPVFEPEPLCMDIVFGPAPSPSATPSKTVSATPSVTVSTSRYPKYPSLTPTSTPSVTPSITPTKTPSISITPSLTPTPSITPSITPTRTVTPTISVTKTPTASVTPTKTPTPTPSVSLGSLVVPECSVIYITNSPNRVYSYNSTTNISTLLNLGTSPSIGVVQDIAHTTNKLWTFDNTGIFEYNITLSPFTSVYNRKINLPIIPGTISLINGLCAIDDTHLLSDKVTITGNQIIKLTLNPSPDNTCLVEELFALPFGRQVSGDIMYTTDDKIIVTTATQPYGLNFYISQYALINGVWTLEFDLLLPNTIPYPNSLATINGMITIFPAWGGTPYSQINNIFPYNITQGSIVNPVSAGASNVPSCCNVSFQSNIIGPSPSPSPTPTKTVTPSITVSPSITPTRTPTPTPSKSPPNNIPCTGTGTLPLPGSSVTYNGVTITVSGTGNISLYPNAWASCNTTTPANTVWLGLSGAFTYTLTFSQPVNNIRIPITGLSTDFDENIFEIFTFTTSGGTPTITSPNNCFSAITGNQISSNGTEDTNNGGGLFTISSPSSFNTLTITGQGGSGGSLFGIDCTSILPAPPANCVSCNTIAMPPTGTGTITNGNLLINTTYNGPELVLGPANGSPFATCTNVSLPVPFVILGATPGAFIYTLNFNQPVNNIKLAISGGGTTLQLTALETFTFNTSGGAPTLSTCGPSCGSIINNNVLSLGYVSPNGGGALIQVNATNPYTQIIITGNGGSTGSAFSLCLDTAIPLPSPSPSVTPTKTATPSKTPSVTATPSISISKTPSITPSITATPSITISPSRTPSVTPSSSPPSAACPLIYMGIEQFPNGFGGFYNKQYVWDPNTNVQQEIVLSTTTNVNGRDIASTGTKLWKNYQAFNPPPNQPAHYIQEWDLSGPPPYTATFNRALVYPADLPSSPGLTAKDNNTLLTTKVATVNGQVRVQIYELNIPAAPAQQLTSTFKFNLNSNFVGDGDLMLTSKPDGTPDKLLLAGVISSPTPGTTNSLIALQQYDYNTGVFEYETILNPLPSGLSQSQGVGGIGQFNNTIYVFYGDIFGTTGYVYTINPNPPYNWTLVNSVINGGGANSILSCSKGKLVGPNSTGCNNMLYRTQTKGYGSYNFTTNTSTVLSVAANPYPANDTTNNIPTVIANTSNKMWVYATGATTSEINLRESNITLSPFTSTFSRNITLPTGFRPGNGLFALSNTTLVGINNIDASIVELNISNNVATYTTKCILPSFANSLGGLIVTSGANPKLIILVQSSRGFCAILQYNYTTGNLEFTKVISPTVTVPSGLAEVNGNIYIMGNNIYKVDTVAPYNLTLIQNTGIQLINTSQLISCIDTNFPSSSCTTCDAGILSQTNILTYNGITIVPSYVGPTNGPFIYYPSEIVCVGTNSSLIPPGTLRLGYYYNNLPGAFTYTLTFSQAVNNIQLLIGGMGALINEQESFAFNTNSGVPTLTSCKGCFDNINGNTITGSANDLSDVIGKGGTLTITSPTSYNTLTISGPGGVLGSIFSICKNSIVPASNPSPSPTPSPSPPCTPCSRPDVIIGTQIWKGCNLDVTTYRNGDPIPQVTDPSQFANLTTGAYCIYNNNSANNCTYGKLYNWYAVNDPRGLAPVGYHIPSSNEWSSLIRFLDPTSTGEMGNYNIAGGKMKTTGTIEAGTGLWRTPNLGATNESGWTGLPGGGVENAQFGGIGMDGVYWTSTDYPPLQGNAYYVDTFFWDPMLALKIYFKTSANSIRLIKDNTPSLGCVYYSSMGYLYNYNPFTNTSSPPILPSNQGSVFEQNSTHTINKYWKANNTNLIQEWISTNNPTVLTLNRNISINTGYATFLYSFAIDDYTLLAVLTNSSANSNSTNPISLKLAHIDITNNTITPAQVTPLFDIGGVPSSIGFGSMLLTTTNKLLFVGTSFINNVNVTNIYQYSYPNGTLEGIIPLSPIVPNGIGQYVKLFESNGNIFLAVSLQPTLSPTTIYQINTNSPYTMTSIGIVPGNPLGFNSSLNCNTVHFNITNTPIPSPTPSPSAPSNAFRTIYKYLDIQLT